MKGKTPRRRNAVETKIIRLRGARSLRPAARAAARVLDAGGLVVFPTDTVYGLAASVFRPAAIRQIYRLKGRSYKKPLPILVAGLAQARPLVETFGQRLESLLKKYWPGPLTVVLKTSHVGRLATGGKPTVGLRVPRHNAALALLRAVDRPLAVTSANKSGRPPAVTGAAAAKIFKGRVHMILDAGPCPGGEVSTVLDAAGDHWSLLREGAVKKKELLNYVY